MPIPVKNFRIAVLAVDCQESFAGAAFQGNVQTERARRNIEVALPEWQRKSWLIYSIFSNAASADRAGIFPSLRSSPQLLKKHESAFTGSDIDQRLKRAHRSSLIVTGFHLTACVAKTAMDAANRGYDVYLPLDLCGEGDRGRNLSTQLLEGKKQRAIARISSAGVKICSWNDLK